MFDVKPVNPSGLIDVEKLKIIPGKINLRNRAVAGPAIRRLTNAAQFPAWQSPSRAALTKADVLRDLETTLNAPQDHRAILTQIGGHLTGGQQSARPRYRSVLPPKTDSVERHHASILSELHRSRYVSPKPAPRAISDSTVMPTLVSIDLPPNTAAAVEGWFSRSQYPSLTEARIVAERPFRSRARKFWVIAVLVPLAFVSYRMLGLRERVIENGTQAVQSLESAKDNLTNLDFLAASENFLSAYEDFSKAGNQLNFVGANLGSLLADLPGAEKLKSAQNMIEIGKLIADTGRSMSVAMAAISKTGLILNPKGNASILSAEIVDPMNRALSESDTNLKKVRVLLADIDMAVIPQDKRAVFEDFKTKFPQLQELVSQGSEFAKFLETMVSVRGTKRYMILFQNSTELRPTGGFPGSYALLTFENGKLKEYKVDDVYNIDGQIKELIIPPKQIQHITPTLAMRDESWFIDFPTSAKKVISYYKKESGLNIDGVITITTDVFTDILKVIGPIEMPAYKLTITADNFLATVQKEVEYGDHKKENRPKQIIMDMAPIVMERLYSADHEKWLEVFDAIVAGLDRKDVLMYFRDINLQNFAVEKGFAGDVRPVPGDYLMVTATNIKGSKTDAVTDTVMKLETNLANGELKHTLTIGRTNNGGSTPYGFYNKQNPAFIRILVPKDSSLVHINGQSIPAYNPLVTYDDHFVRDDDIVRLERSFTVAPQPGVWTYEEAGKTGFAFWMIVDPGSSRTVELEYTVPASVVSSDYALYIQKQPGLKVRNFHFEFSKPDNIEIVSSLPSLHKVGNLFTFSGRLEKDLPISVELK